MKFLSSNGIVIRKNDYGEADRNITLFSQRYGKIELYIKGVRKSKKRDRNAVELLSLSNFIFYRKGERFIVSSFELRESFWGIREDLDKINISLYLLSVLNSILVEEQRKSSLYNYFEKAMKYLDGSNNKLKNSLLICYFLNKIISDEGIAFNLSHGDYFDIENSRITDSKGSHFFKISEKEKLILNGLSGSKGIQTFYKVVEVRDVVKVITLLEKYINYHLHINLNFKDFLGEGFKSGEFS